MAITRSQTRANKTSALRKAHGYKFKAGVVDHILSNHFIAENNTLQIENNLLSLELTNQLTINGSLQHNLRISRQLVQDGRHMQAAIEADQRFLDEFIREVYIAHPEIAFEYRNRISYSDIPTHDPEETEEDEETTHLRNLFGDSDDDEPEDIVSREDRLWHEADF